MTPRQHTQSQTSKIGSTDMSLLPTAIETFHPTAIEAGLVVMALKLSLRLARRTNSGGTADSLLEAALVFGRNPHVATGLETTMNFLGTHLGVDNIAHTLQTPTLPVETMLQLQPAVDGRGPLAIAKDLHMGCHSGIVSMLDLQ